MSSYQPDHYETVAVSQTDQVIGNAGGVGDFLYSLVCSVAAAATSAVVLQDGAAGADIPILPANTPIGVYTVILKMKAKTVANPGWRVTTAAGVTVVAVGTFT